MTTLTDLITRVGAITGRPELTALTKIAIRTATIRAHCTSFFPRDAFVQTVAYAVDGTSAWVSAGNIFTLIPTLRQLKHVQCVDPLTGSVTEELKFMEVDDTYDTNRGWLKDSICKLEGANLMLHCRAQTGAIKLYGYTLPVVTDEGYSSWIANSYPDELAHWAAAIVQFRSGNQEIAGASMKTNIEPFKMLLIESHEQIIPD